MNRYLKIVIPLLLIASLSIFIWYIDGNEETDILDLEQAQKNVKEEIENVNRMEESIYKWINEENMDIGILEDHGHQAMEQYQNKKGVVEFLFASILMDDSDLFIQSFHPETISEDLFQVDVLNKTEVAETFIQEITRNGKLKQVGYENNKGVLGTQSKESKVTLLYDDGEKVTVSITFERSADAHEESEGIYYITTSVLSIIETIKKSTIN